MILAGIFLVFKYQLFYEQRRNDRDRIGSMLRGLLMEDAYIFIMSMLTFLMSLIVMLIVDTDCSVSLWKTDGSLLVFSTSVHWSCEDVIR